MSLTLTLASHNLFHDWLRFIATLVGIVFSVVLVMVQMGLFLGFGHMVTTMIDHASADFWVVPKGAKCFEDPSLLDIKLRNRVAAVPGVASVIPLVIGFSDWRLESGEMTPRLHCRYRSSRRWLGAVKRGRGRCAALFAGS